MESINKENPWNIKLQSFNGNIYDNNIKMLSSLKYTSGLIFLKNKPSLFKKSDDLVLCKICKILICKVSCLKHARLHDRQKDEIGLIYSSSERDDPLKFPHDYGVKKVDTRSLNKKATISSLQKFSKDKRRKIVSHKNCKIGTNYERKMQRNYIEENTNNFVPKSTLNAANPLRIKIQLQPKSEQIARNGNVFEYIKSIIKNSSSQHNENIYQNGSTIGDSGRKNIKYTSRSNHVVVEQEKGAFARSWPSGSAIINENVPQYLRRSNQTSLLLNQRKAESRQRPQAPQVFQAFTKGINTDRTAPKKYVEVKSLLESIVSVSASQPQMSPMCNQDENQRSFQKILIDNGMFSQEDILRCQKSTPIVELGHVTQIKRTSSLPISNPIVHIVQSKSATSRSMTECYPRFLNNYTILPYSRGCPTNIAMSKSDTLVASQPVQSNVRSQYYRNMELSDDEFLLDTTVANHFSAQTVHASLPSIRISNQSAQHNAHLPRVSMSPPPKLYPYARVDSPEHMDTDVHYLPPPDEVITSLSWEL